MGFVSKKGAHVCNVPGTGCFSWRTDVRRYVECLAQTGQAKQPVNRVTRSRLVGQYECSLSVRTPVKPISGAQLTV